jgi:condensin complex subunit 1
MCPQYTSDGNELLDALSDAISLVGDEPLALAEHASFDPVYAVLLHFSSTGPTERARAAELVAAGLAGLTRACKRALSALASDGEVARLREAVKEVVFLQSHLIQESEKLAAANGAAAVAVKGRKSGAGKKGAAKSDEPEWAELRETAIARLLECLELNLCAMWGQRDPDEALLNLFSAAAIAVLEHAAAVKGSAASLREALWRLIALPAVRYGQEISAASSVVSLIVTHEHLPVPMADLMRHLLEEHQAARLVATVVRDVSALSPADMGADSTAPKNVAAFLGALASKAPLMLLANVELLHDVVCSDAYNLRCGAVSALGQLQVAVAAMLSPLPPEVAEPAGTILPTILERLHDTSSFVRTRALATLAALCEARALPEATYFRAGSEGLARLADKNANVRRGALQFYAKLLEFNPFCGALNRTALTARREAIRAQMPEGWTMPEAGELRSPTDSLDPGRDTEAEPGTADGDEGAAKCDGDDRTAEGTPAAGSAKTAIKAAEPQSLSPEVAEKQSALVLLDQALALEALVSSHLAAVSAMLGSQTNSDVLEVMHALVAAHAFDLETVRPAEMLTLVWSREAPVRAAALSAAQAIWLRSDSTPSAKAAAAHTTGVARGLLRLASTCSVAELASLEEVIKEWQAHKLLSFSLHAALWEAVAGRQPELAADEPTPGAHRAAALSLLNMAASSDPGVLKCKLDVVLSLLREAPAPVLARQACVSLLRCAAGGGVAEPTAVSFLRSLEDVMPHRPSDDDAAGWAGFAEAALDSAFALHAAPEEWCGLLIRQLAAAAFPDPAGGAAVCSGSLSRLFFVLGHAAIKMLEHIEACDKKLLKRKAEHGEEGSNGSAAVKPKPKPGGKKAPPPTKDSDALAAELGTDAAAAEANSDALLGLGERLLSHDSMIGCWAPLLCKVCSSLDFPAETRAAAVLAMCKLMATSGAFCEAQLTLLFTLLAKEPEPAVRATIAVALGDLVVRHPNRLEPWTGRIYAQLRDPDAAVRRNVLMVLTHLILNDMVKVKGQVSEMARCLLDREPDIAAHARLFFSEFAKKGSSPVYNLLPDIMSSLSADGSLGNAGFREVMAFLIGFIHKDRQCESMVDKLCARFAASDAVTHHRDIAFCIGALQHTERSVRKLAELIKTYADTLTDDEVHAAFVGIVGRTRKVARAEFRTALDEYEAELAARRGEVVDAPAADAATDASGGGGAAKPAPRGKEEKRKKAPARRARKAAQSEEEESEEEDDEDEADNVEAGAGSAVKPAPRAKEEKRKKAPARRARKAAQSEEEASEGEDDENYPDNVETAKKSRVTKVKPTPAKPRAARTARSRSTAAAE